MHENTPNYNSNIHFLALWSLGGALGGSKCFFGRSRGFFGSESVGFFSKGLVLVHYKVLGGVAMSNFDFTHLSIHATIMQKRIYWPAHSLAGSVKYVIL